MILETDESLMDTGQSVSECSVLHDLGTVVNVLHQRDQLPSLLVRAELGEVLTEVHQTDVQLHRTLACSALLCL